MARRRFFKRSTSEDVSAGTSPAGGHDPSSVSPRRRKREQSVWYNRLALVLLLLTPVVLVCYLLIFLIPALPLNPFPPYAQALATFAPTLTPQPTYTPTRAPTNTSTPTITPRPTWTPTLTATPRPTFNLTVTPTPRGFIPPTHTTTPTMSPTVGPTKSPFNYTAEVLYQRAQAVWHQLVGHCRIDLRARPQTSARYWRESLGR